MLVTRPKRLSKPAYEQLVEFFESRYDARSPTYRERAFMLLGLEDEAVLYRKKLDRLPRGVSLVPTIGTEHRNHCHVHIIDWGDNPVDMPPIEFHDPGLAAAIVWAVFKFERPWAIDGARLRMLVEAPPVARSRMVGLLLSVRFAEWVIYAASKMQDVLVHDRPPESQPSDVLESLSDLQSLYGARCALGIHELNHMLGVEEPEASASHEILRWRWMLHDYVQAFSPQLHEHLEALGRRFRSVRHLDNPTAIWGETCNTRVLDACTGLLLARVAMLDPQSNRDPLRDFSDPLVSRSPFSFAWWCYMVMEVMEEGRSFGERLPIEKIESFVDLARKGVEQVDPELLDALCQTFPSIGAQAG